MSFDKGKLSAAIGSSTSWAGVLRYLGYRVAGGNITTVKKYARRWKISSNHFDPYASQRTHPRRGKVPLEQILVEGSTYSRTHLKQRLYEAGLKTPVCELCGQGETWRGRRMAMILDHISGVHNDNRLENLRIVCPNCAATFETHCGRKNRRNSLRISGHPRQCQACETRFIARSQDQRYCSRSCWYEEQRQRGKLLVGKPQSHLRKVDRPPYEVLIREIENNGYSATGRKFSVSDNAIRKWVRAYERERAIAEGRDPTVVRIPTRTWPNRRRGKDAA